MPPAVEQGEALYAEGKLPEAVACFESVIKDDPQNKHAYNNLGVIAYQSGNIPDAVAHFTKALSIDPYYDKAIENVLDALKTISATQIAGWPAYAFAYLHAMIADGKFEDIEMSVVRRAGAIMDEIQKRQLLSLALDPACTGGDKVVAVLVEAMAELESDLVFRIGAWMDAANPDRSVRDAIARQVCIKCADNDAVREVARRESQLDPNRSRSDEDFFPRRLISQVPKDDPFMKEIPERAPSKEGGLRVLVIADFNIAGQLTGLMRALNRYTNHMARCVIYQEDYLAYDKDIIIRDQSGRVDEVALEEASELVRHADFFHVGRQLVSLPGIDWKKYVSPSNSVFQYYGSHLRNNGKEISEFHTQTGISAITCVYWPIYKILPASYYDIQPYMVEFDELPRAEMDLSGPIRICHAPSNSNYRDLKQSDLIDKTLARLKEENPRVEPVVIEGMQNKECLEFKSRCHIHFVSLWQTFGLNTIESAAMGLVPLAQLANFSRLVLHDSPVVHVTKDTAYDVLKDLLADEARLKERGDACRDWARRHFDARTIVRKYWYLYDLIYHDLSVDYPEIFRD